MHFCSVSTDAYTSYLKPAVVLNRNIDKFEHFNWHLCSPINNYNEVVLHFIESMHVDVENVWPKVIITIKTTEKMRIEISVSVSVSPFNSVFDEN
jgi:hypothetical protein